jgi:pyruvate formate lyase activating enzyme
MISKKDFQIGGFQKLTLLDYPGYVSAIVFTNGCNMRCPFCHNYELVENDIQLDDLISPNEVMDYLIKRGKVLDGVIITGGEPTIQRGLKDFILEIKKNTNLSIKLDTNGLNPDVLEKLLDDKLIDYVAMDVKANYELYPEITRIKNINIEKIKKSIQIIKTKAPNYEFRTTVIKGFHNLDNLKDIINIIGSDSNYYLQKFIVSENVPVKSLGEYSDNEMLEMKEALKNYCPKISVRGLKI